MLRSMTTNALLDIRTYHTLDELLNICDQWEQLLANYPLATTFSTPAWLGSWWRSFGASQSLLAAGFFAESRLVALATFSISSIRVAKAISLRQLRLMSDGSDDADNLDFPVLPGFEESFARALLQFLHAERKNWDFADLNTLPLESPGVGALQEFLRENKWELVERRRPASAISLPGTWEEYLARLSSKERGKIGLRSRRLEKRYEIRIRKCESATELDAMLGALFQLHAKHWSRRGLPGTLHVPERRRFYSDLAGQLLKRGELQLWVLEIKGQIVAVQFGFRYGSTAFSLQEGFDPDYAGDSVGYVLRAQVIRNLISDGVRRYDFLGGIDDSKQRWGAEAEQYLDLRFAMPGSAGAAYVRTHQLAARGKSWLRRKLPTPAWRMLHKINVTLRGNNATSTADKPQSQQGTE